MFETQICTRCHGSGKYSFCESFRDTCFKCKGSGKCYTKRGEIAASFYTESLKVLVSDLKVGQTIRVETMALRYYAPITYIGPLELNGYSMTNGIKTDTYRMLITTEHEKHGESGLLTFPSHKVVVKHDKESLEKFKQDALVYQESLTKTGKPKKIKGVQNENS